MEDDMVYLDTYTLQHDMRIRLPKSILTNMQAEKGKTKFAIYFNKRTNCLLLKGDGCEENATRR